MLQDVAHPGSFAFGKPAHESTLFPVGAGVVVQAGQRGKEGIRELWPELPRWPFLQRSQIDVEPDHREVGVQTGPDENRFIEYQH
jgi:hypothetical protein